MTPIYNRKVKACHRGSFKKKTMFHSRKVHTPLEVSVTYTVLWGDLWYFDLRPVKVSAASKALWHQEYGEAQCNSTQQSVNLAD